MMSWRVERWGLLSVLHGGIGPDRPALPPPWATMPRRLIRERPSSRGVDLKPRGRVLGHPLGTTRRGIERCARLELRNITCNLRIALRTSRNQTAEGQYGPHEAEPNHQTGES